MTYKQVFKVMLIFLLLGACNLFLPPKGFGAYNPVQTVSVVNLGIDLKNDFGAIAKETNDIQTFNGTLVAPYNAVLIIPPGNYVLNFSGDKPILGPVYILGIGKPTLILNKTIRIAGLSGITFNNVRFTSTTNYGTICKITDSKDILFKDCEIDGNGFDGDNPVSQGLMTGFVVENSTNVNFIKNEIKNLITGKGIEYVGCTDCSAINNYVHHTGRAGISISNNNNNCKVLYNRLDFNVINFNVDDGALDLYGPNNHNTELTGNVISNYGSATNSAIGIRIKGSFDTMCYKNKVTSSLYAFALIVVAPRNDVVDSNVDIYSNDLFLLDGTNAQYIIRVIDANNVKVRNNIITSIGKPIKNPENAINFRQNIENLICEYNVIRSDNSDGYFPSSGIYFNPTESNFKDVIIRNNQLKVVGDGIYIANCQNTICNENIVSNQYTGNGAITTKLCADIIIKNNIITQPFNPRISDTENSLSTGVIKSDNIFFSTAVTSGINW